MNQRSKLDMESVYVKVDNSPSDFAHNIIKRSISGLIWRHVHESIRDNIRDLIRLEIDLQLKQLQKQLGVY